MPKYRKITIKGKTWTYTVGPAFVSIRSSDGRVNVAKNRVTALSTNGDRSAITPSIIKIYIWRNLVKGHFSEKPKDQDQAKRIIEAFLDA